MHDLIAETAKLRPVHTAVQSWDGTFTYSDVERLSTQLALHLQSLGVEIGARIPLCFEKSRWAVIALLGVMKAGGTVSLTDPSQPEARLRTIVDQTRATLVVTSEKQRDLGQRICDRGRVIAISQDFFDALEAKDLASFTLPRVPAKSPMYIIFTSGSTGKPKGVILSHENYTSGALPRAEAVGYKSTSRVFDFPSYSFDVSIDCMLCTLLKGGTVCVPSEEARMNDLSGAIRDSRADMVHMTPSVARVLDEDIIPSLDVLGLGGEAVSASDAAVWGKQTNLIIAYGPSECTVGCTINNTVGESTGIGRGVGGTTWIVDPEDHDRLTPLGQVGELLIEGPVVGLGYLDEPEKTNEVFIDDPVWLTRGFGKFAGRRGRLYKTGDLVRYESRRGGSIEFVGRKDQQVKLRGQRVELTEVEHHLRGCLAPGIKVSAEVVKTERGHPVLVAFLCETTSSGDSTPEEIQASPSLLEQLKTLETDLSAKVPRYMVPTSIIILSAMPSLVSGKTDRKRLRELGALHLQHQSSPSSEARAQELEVATSEAEDKLMAAWQAVLGSDTRIHLESSFFSLGGDSLRAMKLVAAAREKGLMLTVGAIFGSPKLRDMALRTSASTEVTESSISPFSLLAPGWDQQLAIQDVANFCQVDPETVEDVYPCTPLQEALMALSAKSKEAYIAQRVVEVESMNEAGRLLAAFDLVAKSSPILRTRIVQIPARGLFQVVVRGDLAHQKHDDLSTFLRDDKAHAMDLGKPLVRYTVVEDSTTQKVKFVLTMHHALYDGWSMPLIIERVNKAFHSQPSSRHVGFRNFIGYLSKLDRSSSEKFWRDRLAGANPRQFPHVPRPGYQTRADSLLEEYVPLPQGLPGNATAATVVRAAWALVAAQYVGSRDVIYGETLTGRNAPVVGAEEIEGPMITTIPFRVQIDTRSTVSEYLQDIQEQTTAQIPHEHFGLQHIRRLSPDALNACELRTGLVLHPKGQTSGEKSPLSSPADDLVPANDEEAAQEALKFNTYALMLVCSIDADGFLVMASFDSNTVDKDTMQRALTRFREVSEKLCRVPASTKLVDITCSLDDDAEQVKAVYEGMTDAGLEAFATARAACVTDLADTSQVLPLGACGDLIICADGYLDLEQTQAPAFLQTLGIATPDGTFYRTGKKAILRPSGIFQILSSAQASIPDRPAQSKPTATTTQRLRTLRSLWSQILQLPEVEITAESNFFQLGGDSIFAMKLVSEARSKGVRLSVMQIFDNKALQDMAAVMEEEHDDKQVDVSRVAPFELLDSGDATAFVESIVQPQLADPSWKVVDVYPARPLQAIAVKGTTTIPRFSARYELINFSAPIATEQLKSACQRLVRHNEILRTVFVEHEGKTYSVVLEAPEAEFTVYDIDTDVRDFSHQLCRLDVMTKMPLGSSFVKFFFVRRSERESFLIFRISHAQYDEACLPLFLKQLSELYTSSLATKTAPFSGYVGHVLKSDNASSVRYWQSLLSGARMSFLKPSVPVLKRNHFAIQRSVDISRWSNTTTLATLPTAAWALTLSRRLGTLDVLFGEVVSGRKTSFPNAEEVGGPCWQYIPLRLNISRAWTGSDLLDAVQRQHVSSSAHEGMSLTEITQHCDLPGLEGEEWFDSVVHQALAGAGEMHFGGGEGEAVRATSEALYVHEEPLREWKVQAFFGDGEMVLEIVTFESWGEFARDLLDDLVGAAESLVQRPEEELEMGFQ